MHRYITLRGAAGPLPRAAVRAAVLAALGLASSAFGQVTGFGGSSETGWQANGNTTGVPSVSGTGTASDVLTVTTAANSEASSYWSTTPQDITNFVANFTYTDVSTGGADGMVFGFQNVGTTALGAGGGGMGFSGLSGNAAGDAFNIYSGNGGSGTQFNASPVGTLARTPTVGPDITSGHPINVTLSYLQSDNTVVEKLLDTTNGVSSLRVYQNVNLSAAVGGNTAFIGFTGGTGGVNANQTVTNFSFTPGAATPAPAPIFTPIAATGYNQNMVISKASGATGITATMDGGTAKGGDTFYELGVNTGNPNTGIPSAGQPFRSMNDPYHSFQLQPFSGNNALMLDASNPTGTLTLTDQTKAYNSLSFLVSEANGNTTFTATVHFANGSTEVHSGVTAPDWFGNTGFAYIADGREQVNGTFDNVGGINPRLYQSDIILTDSTDPISSIDFTFGGSGTQRTAIFGVSGAVPEPGILGSLAVAGIALIRRRRA